MANEIPGLDLKNNGGNVVISQSESKFLNSVIVSASSQSNNSVEFGFRSIYSNLFIQFKGSNNKLIVDHHCRLTGRFVFDGDNNTITIAPNTSFEGVNLVASEGGKISIGQDCMFSYGIEIRTSDSHAIFDRETKQRINFASDVCIGNHVWLGMGVKVLSGVNIEDGCVVGTSAVVARSLGDKHSIYAGVPAKKIRENIIWSRYKNDVFPEEIYERLMKNGI